MTQRLRIVTFNLENLDDRPGVEPSIDARVAVLRPQLLRADADILCLQEINAQPAGKRRPRLLSALDRLLENTPYAGFQRAVTHTSSGSGPADVHNLAILSRLPIVKTDQIHHHLVPPIGYRPLTAEPTAKEPEPVTWDRPLLHATIDLSPMGQAGRRLHVINLHLRSPLAGFIPGQKQSAFSWKSVRGWAEGYFLATLKRNGQALETRFVVDRLFDDDPEAWVAVIGDFNAALDAPPVRIICGREEDTGNGQLAARALIMVERGIPKSQRYSVLHHGKGVMLDHILISRALLGAFRHIEIHNESLEDELVAFANVSNPPDSFHAPVAADFEFL